MNKITFYLDEVENVLNKRHQPPICAEVDPSNYCNNACHFCCFNHYLEQHREHLSLEAFTKFLYEFVAVEGKAITFTGGGEPLMNPDFLSMARMAKARGVQPGLVTNGTLLNRIRGSENIFRFIRISLNAHNREIYLKIHGTDFFDKVIRNIRYILELKERPHVGLSYVVCEENKDYEDEFTQLGKELGVEYVQIKPDIYNFKRLQVDGVCEGIKISNPLYPVEEYGKTPCAVAGLVFILNATGDVFYCCVQRGNPDFRLGNIETHSISDLVKIREQFTPDLSQCSTCRYTSYARHYEKYKDSRFIFLRHKEFI